MAVVVNVYLVELGSLLILGLQSVNPGNWTVHLFVNLRQPQNTDDLNDYVECSLPGYSPFSINAVEWQGGIQPTGQSSFQYPQITWVFDAYTAPQQTVYGYYLLDQTSNVLYAEMFPAPFPVPPAGGELPLILTWTAEQCPTM